MRRISSINSLQTATKPSLSPPAMAQQRSPWHSPVPYLFGGLAAMLGLIGFTLFILACSYWRLSGRLEGNRDGERDVESGEKEGDSDKVVKIYDEKILVIMAGDEKPTFLATPVSNKVSSFGDKNDNFEEKEGSEKAESREKVKEETSVHDHHQLPAIIENSDNHERQQNQENQ